VRGLEAADALQVLARLEVEHFDGVVHLGGDEEVVALEVDGEVIEVAGDLRQGRHAEEGEWLAEGRV